MQVLRRKGDVMRNVLIGYALFLFLASVCFASTDTVMLVTDMASIDASVATAAAAKTGVPVLVLQDGKLNSDTISAIQSLDPNHIVLVGGPLVVLPEVETQLTAMNYSVIRLWGMDRTGTAIAVAKHFWTDGLPCAVLVADTKNSSADSARQEIASSFASAFNCSLVPVPEGTVPSEVLDTITGLNATNVWYIGGSAFPGMREILHQFNYTEITGSDTDLWNRTDNITNSARFGKIVIVATPDWKAAPGFAGYPKGMSVVRHVSDVSQLGPVIDFIQSHNITNVTVVGIPPLSQQIADALAAQNITATQVSGNNASDISDKLISKMKQAWDDKKMKSELALLSKASKIKAQLLNQLNSTIDKLQAAESDASSLADGADKTAYIAAIQNATSVLSNATSLIMQGSYNEARDLITNAMNFQELRILHRQALGVNLTNDINDEEQSVDNAQGQTGADVSKAAAAMQQVRAKCMNSSIVENLLNSSMTLKAEMDAARASGDYKGAAGLSIKARNIASMANSIGSACQAKGIMPMIAGAIAKRRGIVAKAKP